MITSLRKIFIFIFTVFILMIPKLSFSFSPDDLATKLINQDIQIRQEAVSELIRLQHKDKERFDNLIRDALIKDALVKFYEIELNLEDERLKDTGNDWGEYYLHITRLVRCTKDPRFIPLYLKEMTGNSQANKALAELGETAVAPLLDKLANGNYRERHSSAFTFVLMLKLKDCVYPLSEKSKIKIKEALIKSSSDVSGHVRFSVVMALGELNDISNIPLLEKIAKEDPYSRKKADGSVVYPVREEAQKLLEKLKKELYVISEIKNGNFRIVREDDYDDYHVKKEYRTPEVREALYQLLIDSKDDPDFCDPHECREYHDLLSIMGSIQETRAIPYLTTRLGQGFAQRSMALMGEPALEVVLELWDKSGKASSWKEDYSWGVVGVLYEMVKEKEDEEDYKPKGESRKKIKKILIKALNNKDGVTRIVAVRGLGEMASQGDTDVIPLIKKTAKEDPYFKDFSKDPHFRLKKRYIVREEAEKVLEKLKKEGKIDEKAQKESGSNLECAEKAS